jgi:hypothetical protein
MISKFHQNTFLLTNESSKNMVGLMIRWTYTNARGLATVHNISTDSFDGVHDALLAARATLIVAPNTFCRSLTSRCPIPGRSLAI